MTPREKAIELVDQYNFIYIQNYTSIHEVKQCALIAVDEKNAAYCHDGSGPGGLHHVAGAERRHQTERCL